MSSRDIQDNNIYFYVVYIIFLFFSKKKKSTFSKEKRSSSIKNLLGTTEKPPLPPGISPFLQSQLLIYDFFSNSDSQWTFPYDGF